MFEGRDEIDKDSESDERGNETPFIESSIEEFEGFICSSDSSVILIQV